MRVKIGTSIDQDLLRRAQDVAAREKQHLNEFIEAALTQYLRNLERQVGTDVAARTWATSKLDARTLRCIMDEDLYDA